MNQRDGLLPALELAAHYDTKIVIEAAAVEAREIEVSVLGNDNPTASVPGEIIPSREFYDYGAKYKDANSQLIIPARLSAECTRRLREMALTAFQACEASGLARVDFFVHRSSEAIWLNEINTMPGFTSVSMYPKLWEATGLSYSALIDRLVELALERFAEKSRLKRAMNSSGKRGGGRHERGIETPMACRVQMVAFDRGQSGLGHSFYRNYWNAAVPAFGEISMHLIRLRSVFWRYLGVGTLIAGMWGFVAIRQRVQKPSDTRHERIRHRGT